MMVSVLNNFSKNELSSLHIYNEYCGDTSGLPKALGIALESFYMYFIMNHHHLLFVTYDSDSLHIYNKYCGNTSRLLKVLSVLFKSRNMLYIFKPLLYYIHDTPSYE